MKPRRFDLYPADWLASLAGWKLGAAAWGVYNAIILISYDECRPCIAEAELVERMVGLMGENPRTIRAAIGRLEKAGKLTRNGAELEPKKVRTTIESASNRVRMNVERGANGGRISGEVRREKSRINGLGEAKGSGAHRSTQSPSPSPSSSEAIGFAETNPKQASEEGGKPDLIKATATELMRLTGWRDEGRIDVAIFRLMGSGATVDELLTIAAELGRQRIAEPRGPESYIRQCLIRHRTEKRPNLPPPKAPAKIERSDPAWLAYRDRRKWAMGQGYSPADPEWPKEPPMPAAESAA